MNLADLLPAFPWEGPPLPRFLNIPWPWLQGGGEGLSLLPLPNLLSFPNIDGAETIYENEELIEWTDWRGRERKARITRKVRRR